ncbi:MAG: GDP-mannose 4,6-dehydratase [Actinomycetota bacterium]|nr:GDP-mannose 4,6-dehydratase [Actinomycetota bacterium]
MVLTPGLVTEDTPADPRNVYAACNVAREHLAIVWARATGGQAIALRYHNVYVPPMPKTLPTPVWPACSGPLACGVASRVFEDGGQRRSFVHVADVAAANILAVQAMTEGAVPGFRAYDVGAAEVHTIGQLACELSRHSSAPDPVVSVEFRLGDVRDIAHSSERIRAELGWVPRPALVDGMKEFALAGPCGVDRPRTGWQYPGRCRFEWRTLGWSVTARGRRGGTAHAGGTAMLGRDRCTPSPL